MVNRVGALRVDDCAVEALLRLSGENALRLEGENVLRNRVSASRVDGVVEEVLRLSGENVLVLEDESVLRLNEESVVLPVVDRVRALPRDRDADVRALNGGESAVTGSDDVGVLLVVRAREDAGVVRRDAGTGMAPEDANEDVGVALKELNERILASIDAFSASM